MPKFGNIVTSINSPYFDKYQLRPYNPAELYQRKGWEIYDEMREDDQIAALFRLKKDLMLNSGYDIECADETICEFIEWNLNEVLNFHQHLYEILTAFDYGFSLTEMAHGMMPDSPFPDKICLVALKTRAPHTFEIKQDESGDVTEIKQYGGGVSMKGTGSTADVILPPEKFLHYVHNQEFDGVYGQSDLDRGVYTAWYSKKYLIKFYNIYMERFGNPIAVAKYDKTKVKDEHVTQISNILKNISAKTGIVIPAEIELEIMQATAGGEKGFESAIDRYNLMIARRFGVPDLLGMGGSQTGGGSYSLGDRQYVMFLQTLERPRRYLERLINLQLIKPLVAMNFSTDEECTFKFRPISDEEKIKRVQQIVDAIQKGAITKTTETENFIRTSMGMEELDEDDIPEPAPQVQMPQDMPDQQGDMPANSMPDMPMDQMKPMPKNYASLNKYDRKVNYSRVSSVLTDSSLKLKQDLAKVIKDSVNQLMSTVRAKKVIELKKLGVVRELQLKGWDKFRVTLKRGLADVADSGWSEAQSEIGQVKSNIIEQDLVTVNAEEFLGHITSEISGLQRDQILNTIKQIISNGIQSGLSYQQVASRIDDALKGYDINVAAGQDGVTAPKLDTIVSTNVTKAYNQGRWEYFNQNPDMMQGYMYSAILDERTTERCSQLSGQVFKPSDASGIIPPLHYNCRSLLVPVTTMEDTPDFSSAADIPPKPDGYFK